MTKAEQAVTMALSLVNTGVYELGTGDCDTPVGGPSDCAGFAINKCYNIRRHHPPFNRGPWASVIDDLNCNSAIEDADHHQELFIPVPRAVPERAAVQPGDLITYPTFYLPGIKAPFIGHVAIITEVPTNWRSYADLTVVQCCGPNGHNPGIIKTNGAHWDDHDKTWPLPQHRTRLIRVKE